MKEIQSFQIRRTKHAATCGTLGNTVIANDTSTQSADQPQASTETMPKALSIKVYSVLPHLLIFDPFKGP